jgi:hypothetical protein
MDALNGSIKSLAQREMDRQEKETAHLANQTVCPSSGPFHLPSPSSSDLVL